MSLTIDEKKNFIGQVYSPAAPINSDKLFCGRREQLNRINAAVNERGQHIAIYGERGVGKTSLANIVEKRYIGAITAKITCNNESSLAGLWKSAFKRIPIGYQIRRQIRFSVDEKNEEIIEKIGTISDLIDKSVDLDIDDITAHLDYVRLLETNTLLVFDEFDQISDKKVVNAFANIIKYLSDTVPNVSIMIVGIGTSITDMIGEHQSVERCIRQIELKKMSDIELEEIVNTATTKLEMEIDSKILAKIVEYSSGFPHFTHLLGKFSTMEALKLDENKIVLRHFNNAMKESLENVHESIRLQYQKAVSSTKETTLFNDVLTASAMIKSDEHNTFRAIDVEKYLSSEMGYKKTIQAFTYHLGKLCSPERGQVLQKVSIAKSRNRYKYANPLFKAYVRLRYHNERMLKSESKKTKGSI